MAAIPEKHVASDICPSLTENDDDHAEKRGHGRPPPESPRLIRSPSVIAARNIASIGAMKVSAMDWASGTRPMPQKNKAAMTITSIERTICTVSVRRSGHDFRRGR